MIILLTHAYLGLHVIQRGVIFVDLALAQMAALDAPMPLGLILTSEWCSATAQNGNTLPESLRLQLREGLSQLEEITGSRFGDGSNPLRLA